ncbi:DNA-binding transcriptional regulator, LysR family [Nakamurella panacisegetis]|uniref:DNA-binding transcriptional regulator, LysR family n=1 Tax=Nakamurella panacisegetis TaxID=1090615 RepID=A0A1H0P2B1_9ACTN|nr:LysR family transcriptional regulator [Nakamurella panacisegetis]SDO99152.1 DNA-binding transcriptional regulator, LysR family [Nakamurella panacisegetis]
MIDLRRLEILRELDRCGTIAATAEVVHLTPSAVSQQLAALSREAGTPMLEPDGRRVRLTAAAQLLLRHAHEVFTHLEHAESDLAAFRRGDAGVVRLGAFPTAIRGIAVPVLNQLRSSRLEVQIREVQPEHTVDALLSRSVDLAVTLTGGSEVLGADDPRLTDEHLIDDVMDVALPLDHRLAGETSIDLADLADDDWITHMAGVPCWAAMRTACARAGFVPRSRHSADDFTGAVALVGTGAGICLLPRLAQGPFSSDPVVVIPVAGEPPLRRIAVQYRAGTHDQPHIAPVLTALRAVAAAHAAAAPLAAAVPRPSQVRMPVRA